MEVSVSEARMVAYVGLGFVGARNGVLVELGMEA